MNLCHILLVAERLGKYKFLINIYLSLDMK